MQIFFLNPGEKPVRPGVFGNGAPRLRRFNSRTPLRLQNCVYASRRPSGRGARTPGSRTDSGAIQDWSADSHERAFLSSDQAASCCGRTPTAFYPKAQGWRASAYPGWTFRTENNPNGVASHRPFDLLRKCPGSADFSPPGAVAA